MRLVVIESPYAGNNYASVEEHVEYAKRAVADSLSRDEAPLASHLLYPGVLDDNAPEQRELGIKAGHAWTPSADAVVVYADYGMSYGMSRGILAAEAARVDVIYRFIGKNEED